MRLFSRLFLLASFGYAFGVLFYISENQYSQANADTNHVVISQIKLSGVTANDEFIELYNPTDATIDLASWRLARKTATASATPSNLVASLSGTIAPRSYFLITPKDTSASATADLVYSTTTTISTNNTILLYSDAGQTIVDKVGFGTAFDKETEAFNPNPSASESAMRKASVNSTANTLQTGGTESTYGNGYDTDNNATDFVLIPQAQPRNKKSPAAQNIPTNTPAVSPTILPTTLPTIAPTNIPTNSPTPTSTPTPTLLPTTLPTYTPVPTSIPTATPTQKPTPTATKTPTPMPTSKPTATSTPTPKPTKAPTPTNKPTVVPTQMPTIVPTKVVTPTTAPTQKPTTAPTTLPTLVPTLPVTPSPTVTPTPTSEIIVDQQLANNRRLVCIQTTRTISILGLKLSIPSITCEIIRPL